jgi:hypothetical protein
MPALPRRGSRWTRVTLTLLILTFAGASAAWGMAAANGAGATISSDLPDYNPGQTVTLSGGGWDSGGAAVHIVVNDDEGQTWQHVADVRPDADGAITDTFSLPSFFVAAYSVKASQSTEAGTITATSSFTDANPSADVDQCANDPAPSPSSDGCSANASDWVNGNLGSSKSLYFEGDSIPYRMKFDNLAPGSHTATIEWDTTKGGTHALDYLTSFDRTVATADPLLGVSGISGSPSTFAIPKDPQVDPGAGVTQASGNFSMYGATITAASAYSYADGAGFSGDKSARITLTFTVAAGKPNPVLAWGGHISSRADWGANKSAVAIPGSPYHTRLIGLDGSGGNQDLSLSADAVVFPGSLTVVKEATPETTTSFGFTGSPAPLTGFSLVDDGTSANTKLFGNITNFQTYTVNESSVPATWGFDSAACAVTTPNGGSYTTDTTTVAVALEEGENWTCTYRNSIRVGTLVVKKHVVNDNGGTASASAWDLHVSSGTSDVAGSPAAGAESGTSYTLIGGEYSVSETGGPSGYAQTSIAGDCASDGTVTVVAGTTKTCTITNDDVAPKLHLRKVVTNDNGGTATSADFTLSATGDEAGNNLSGTSPVDSGATLKADTWDLSESGPEGYTRSDWVCVGGTQAGSTITLVAGGEATCTITNDDIAPKLHLRKVVVNDNGGTAQVADFTLTADGAGANDLSGSSPVDSGASIKADTWTLSETGPDGYGSGDWTCDGGTQGTGADKNKITVGLAGEATCTITNDDVAPKLHLRKVVVNDNGGTKTAADFRLTADGDGSNDLSGTSPVDSGATLKADTWTLSETMVAGYAAGDWACVGGTQAGNTIRVGVGGEATCTITNDDIAPRLHLRKVVVNDNGGTAKVADFTLTANGAGTNDLTGTSPVDSVASIKADTWTLSETSQYGYTASDWTCDGGTQGTGADKSKITVGIGGEATCTITNDDQPGTIVIIKNAKPATGTFAFTTTGAGYSGFSLTGATASSGNRNTQTLSAGSYTVKETTQLGWTLTGIGGSTDAATPYACVTTGAGGSTGSGSLDTQTATVNLRNGDTVTCSFENTGNGATRTQGFWATHPQLAQIAWDGGSKYGHAFPGVAATPGIMDRAICGRTVTSPFTTASNSLMGGFWGSVSSKVVGGKRSSLDQSRMQQLQQLLAAELNASAFGSVPSGGTAAFGQWEAALCGTNASAISSAQSQAASFNSAGDSSSFTPGTSADSKNARLWADLKFWDVFQ